MILTVSQIGTHENKIEVKLEVSSKNQGSQHERIRSVQLQ